MANELLDFVMSLVRDPDVAARYADNPQQAIVDAHLTGVSSADVNNLIPVVSESLSIAPAHDAADANVWASGAATAAFDAFGDHLPAVDPHHPVVDQPVITPVDTGQWHTPGLDPQVFDAPSAPAEAEVHDIAPLPETAHVDPVFDHPVDHGFDDHAVDDHHGWDPHF